MRGEADDHVGSGVVKFTVEFVEGAQKRRLPVEKVARSFEKIGNEANKGPKPGAVVDTFVAGLEKDVDKDK